ncbi:MAG TPA: hypothetical protein PLB05_01000 [Candidatus Omnitrophota bacterium]|nr:hypothetical protein [Candidatus Omnitrophota bacterium]
MSPILHRVARPLNRMFAGLSFILLALQLPFLASVVLPVHDTMHIFGIFHAFYNEFFFRGKIMQWFPEVSYGLPTHMNQLMNLSPLSYFAMLAGSLLRIKDVLFLYKLSLCLEAFVFLAGVYKLAGLLFRRKDTVFFVCLSSLGSVFLYAQIFLNFRIVYLFPWALFYFVRFSRERSGAWLWSGGSCLLISLWGSLPYYAVLWLMVLFFLGLPFITRLPGLATRAFSPRGKSILMLALLLALLAIYFFDARHLTYGVTLVSPGRDSQSGQIAVTEFMDYGGRGSLGEIMSSLLFARPFFLSNGSGMDNTVYVGLIPLFFVLWAGVFVRERGFYAFFLVYVVLLLLAVSPLMARLLYAFPGMAYFRHTGLVMGFARLFLIVSAGYGWEHFWKSEGWNNRFNLAVVFCFIFLWGGAFFFLLWKNGRFEPLPLFSQIRIVLPGVVFFLSLLALAWGKTAVRGRGAGRFPEAFIVFCLVDMVLFQVAAYHHLPHLRTPEERGVLSSRFVSKRLFQAERVPRPQTDRSKKAYQLMEEFGKAPQYTYNDSFYQFDPCFIPVRVDMICPGIEYLYRFNPVLPTVLSGCHEPKLRLISRATWMAPEQRDRAFRNLVVALERLSVMLPGGPQNAIAVLTARTRGQLILPAEEAKMGPSGAGGAPIELSLEQQRDIRVEEYTSERLLCRARVPVSPGAWMLYSQAYHPGWRASIDGTRVGISQAFGAFMAVFVPEGEHHILFEFNNGAGTVLSYLVAVVGFLAGGILVLLSFRVLLSREQDGGPGGC